MDSERNGWHLVAGLGWALRAGAPEIPIPDDLLFRRLSLKKEVVPLPSLLFPQVVLEFRSMCGPSLSAATSYT